MTRRIQSSNFKSLESFLSASFLTSVWMSIVLYVLNNREILERPKWTSLIFAAFCVKYAFDKEIGSLRQYYKEDFFQKTTLNTAWIFWIFLWVSPLIFMYNFVEMHSRTWQEIAMGTGALYAVLLLKWFLLVFLGHRALLWYAKKYAVEKK